MALDFRKYLAGSLLAHAGLIALLIASPFLFFSQAYRFKREKVTWLTLPKGVGETFGTPLKKTTALPRATIEEQKKALQAPDALLDTKQPEQIVKGKTPPVPAAVPAQPAAPAAATDRRVSTAAPAKKPAKSERDQTIERALSGTRQSVLKKKAELEAAQIEKGEPGGFAAGSPNVSHVSPADPEYVLYQMTVRKQIIDQWIVPQKYVAGNYQLICRLIVRINDRGEVVQAAWEKTSGSEAFDQSALRAVQRASPLKAPPERLKEEAIVDGFLIEFSPMAKS